jgi:hypothetical protein
VAEVKVATEINNNKKKKEPQYHCTAVKKLFAAMTNLLIP